MSERIRQARLDAPLTEGERAARSSRQTGPLTQAELALRMGVDRIQVNKLENGGPVGTRMAARLAQALGGTPDDWLEPRDTRAQQIREIGELKERVETLERLLRDLRDA